MGEITVMPEGLVKIGTGLYNHVMPSVQAQVASQIKVRDLSNTSIVLSPADYSSWQDVRSQLMAEGKSALKAKLDADCAACAHDVEMLKGLKDKFHDNERDLEHKIDTTVHTFSATVEIEYNFLS